MACKYVKDFEFGEKKASRPAVKGYRAGGKVDAKVAVHKHEKAMHEGEPLTKLKCGGLPKRK